MNLRRIYDILDKDEKEVLRGLLFDEDNGKTHIKTFVLNHGKDLDPCLKNGLLSLMEAYRPTRYIEDVNLMDLLRCRNVGKQRVAEFKELRDNTIYRN